MYHIGSEITIEPITLVAGGEALARVDGFPVFTAGIFPGDRAVVRLVEVRKGFARAELIRLVEPGPRRRSEPCPIAEECGGCDWTALRLDHQLEAKRGILVESLRRIGKFDPASLPPIDLHPSPLNYRIRSRLHRDGDVVGFYAMRSRNVVQLAKECEVVGVETAGKWSGTLQPDETGGLKSAAPQNNASHDEIETWELDGKLISGERELSIRVGEFAWRLSTGAFFQVNRHLLQTMIRLVTGHAARVRNRATAVDLYAGVGFFSLPIAKLFREVIAIEGSPVSARYARVNAPPNMRVVERAVEHARIPEADFIFLDPPRAGARKEVVAQVGQKAREVICYLSCDPVTFSRDANRLTASGWRLSTLALLDLFPNTHHVETLSSFERAR